ncbi:MBL fold metallo-hydrolase [Bacteroidia bacterium]|nr:MBL fold metallo-hydrolase [Bacteroidia bacterium]
MPRITFLGTGTSQGVPPIGCTSPVCLSQDPKDKRLRCSILVDYGDTKIVVDTGPDFRQQMLSVRATQLDAVLFTHEHKDHTAGLDDIRPFNFMQDKPMDIYATPWVQDALKKQFDYIFADLKYPGLPKVNLLNASKDEVIEINGHRIVPIEVMHHKLPVLGFRFDDFTYITDANYISPEEKEKIKGTKVLVLNALRKEAHISHFTLQEAIDLARELEVDQTYLTHISFQLGFHAEEDAKLPSGINLAYDGLEIEV